MDSPSRPDSKQLACEGTVGAPRLARRKPIQDGGSLASLFVGWLKGKP